jgi:hypothetical protein
LKCLGIRRIRIIIIIKLILIYYVDKSVLLTTQLMVAVPMGTVSLLVFCYLRTRWNTMFAPRSRLQKLAPDPLPTTFFGWIMPLYNMPESHILERVGLDAAVVCC